MRRGRGEPDGGEAEVAQLAVAVRTDEDVLRLEVAIDDRVRMQVLEPEHHLGGVEARLPSMGEMGLISMQVLEFEHHSVGQKRAIFSENIS